MRREPLALAGTYAVAWFLLNAFRAALPVMLPELRRLHGIEYGDAGLIFGALFLGIALLQLPSGLLGDLIGDRAVVVASLVGASVLLGLFGLATAVPALLALAFLFGAAVGGFRSVSISAVAKAVPDRHRNAAMGIMAAGNPLGNLVGPAAAGAAIAAIGVTRMPPAFGAVGVALSLLVGVWLYRGPGHAGSEGGPAVDWGSVRQHVRALVDALRSPAGLLVVAISTCFSVVWQGAFAFLPSYLVEVQGLAIEGTGLVTGVTFGVGIVASVAAGRAADRVGEGVTLGAGFGLGAISLAALLAFESLLPVVIALVGLGFGLGGITPPRDNLVASLAPPENRGSVVGGVRTTYILLASAATVATGYLIEGTGFRIALALFAVVLAFGAAGSLALGRVAGDEAA